jgi:hypothetical protein
MPTVNANITEAAQVLKKNLPAKYTWDKIVVLGLAEAMREIGMAQAKKMNAAKKAMSVHT